MHGTTLGRRGGKGSSQPHTCPPCPENKLGVSARRRARGRMCVGGGPGELLDTDQESCWTRFREHLNEERVRNQRRRGAGVGAVRVCLRSPLPTLLDTGGQCVTAKHSGARYRNGSVPDVLSTYHLAASVPERVVLHTLRRVDGGLEERAAHTLQNCRTVHGGFHRHRRVPPRRCRGPFPGTRRRVARREDRLVGQSHALPNLAAPGRCHLGIRPTSGDVAPRGRNGVRHWGAPVQLYAPGQEERVEESNIWP